MNKTARKRTFVWITWSVLTSMVLIGAYPIVNRQQPRTPSHSSAAVTYSH